MIIQTASFKNLHGHLNPNLSFQRDISILTGVNGSGKTTILNAMAWMLSPTSVQGGLPAAYLLSCLEFDEINIAYTVPGQRKYQRLQARRSEDAIELSVQGIDSALHIPIVTEPPSRLSHEARLPDESLAPVIRSMDDQQNHAVLRHLNDLPGPLYLPLDRRWTEDRNDPDRHPSRRRLHNRRSTTAGHLPIQEVLPLAESAFRDEQFRIYNLNQALRNSFLTSLFAVADTPISSPVWTLQQLRDRRQRMDRALRNLGVHEIQEASQEYFSRLEPVAEQLGGRTKPNDWSEDPQSDMWVDWILYAEPATSRIEGLISLIEEYDNDRSNITRRSRNFLQSVNSFLSDTGKTLRFSSGFTLGVDLPNCQHISSYQLSSGELQLLILFTFLYFQFDDPDEEFVIMVDEPELSLHVAWQDRYIDSVQAANPNAQLIIATHSPEIVGPARHAIRDISPKIN